MEKLACPRCFSTDDLATVEQLMAHANCEKITEAGPEFSGSSQEFWENSETVGVTCSSCSWEYLGEDWLNKLV